MRHATLTSESIGDHCEAHRVVTDAGIEVDIIVSGDGRGVDVFRDGVEMTTRYSPVTNVAVDSVCASCYN
jgi:hypothetical protein